MKCPRCGADSGVLATRHDPHLTIRRRRRCERGHAFTTVEMHAAAACSAKQRLAVFAATVRKRWEIWQRDVQIAQQLHTGWRVLANRFQLTKTSVYLAAKRGRSNLRGGA